MVKFNPNKDFYSVAEAAKVLGVTRIAVFKKIKNGKIQAEKVGRNYIIRSSQLSNPGGVLPEQKEEIKKIVKKAVREYGETFRRLGKEE